MSLQKAEVNANGQNVYVTFVWGGPQKVAEGVADGVRTQRLWANDAALGEIGHDRPEDLRVTKRV